MVHGSCWTLPSQAEPSCYPGVLTASQSEDKRAQFKAAEHENKEALSCFIKKKYVIIIIVSKEKEKAIVLSVPLHFKLWKEKVSYKSYRPIQEMCLKVEIQNFDKGHRKTASVCGNHG